MYTSAFIAVSYLSFIWVGLKHKLCIQKYKNRKDSNLLNGNYTIVIYIYICMYGLYSSTVERNTVNILIHVQFVLRAPGVLSQLVESCATDTKLMSSSLLHVLYKSAIYHFEQEKGLLYIYIYIIYSLSL